MFFPRCQKETLTNLGVCSSRSKEGKRAEEAGWHEGPVKELGGPAERGREARRAVGKFWKAVHGTGVAALP